MTQIKVIDRATGTIVDVKSEVERQFGVKLPEGLDTKAKLNKFLSDIYGVKALNAKIYLLSMNVVSDQTDNSFAIECGSSVKSFTAADAFQAIRVSKIFTLDNEM